jgi:predicted Zn finger-like uncharacterized protein
MKIACQSCQAKYTIADEKVLGKVVKIRCKKCSATIVINGNESQGAEAPQDAGVLDFTGPASNEQWTVNVADGDQRTMVAAEIVKECRAGVITDETYCWKDGMADWLPLREIEQLYGAANMGPRPSLEDVPMGGGGLFGGADAPTEERHVNGNGVQPAPALFGGGDAGADASPAPAAARRAGGRGGGGADLFGGVAQAGGEEDFGGKGLAAGGGAAVDEKLTGQRNENSVLFSLSALTDSKGGPPPAPKDRTTAQADGSGLIDIRALSANMSGGDKAGKNHVDDIMNLSGGGAFGAALAAPILAPPPMADIPGQPGYGGDSESKGGSKTLLIGLLGGGGLIALAIVLAVVLLRPSGNTQAGNGGPLPSATLAMNDPTAPGTGAGPGSTGGTAVTPPGTAAVAPASATPPAADTSQATLPGQNTKAGTPTTQPKAASGGGNPPSTPKADPGGGGGSPPANPTPPAAPKSGGTLEDEMRKSAGGGGAAPPPAAAGGTAPFDRGAAAAAIGGVNIQSCKKADGPTGGGHIQITFGPDGNVQTAVVDQPPFAGTPVGGCIAGKFRGAHVPAFSGSPVKVGKSFTIN